MIKGINQWSLPASPEGLFSALQRSVDAGISHVELCIAPVDDREIKHGSPEPELDQLFSLVEQGVNAKNYSLRLLDSTEALAKVKGVVAKAGAKVVGVTTLDLFRFTLTTNDTQNRGAAVDIVRKMVDICSFLDGKIVLIEPGVVTSKLSYQTAYRNCQEALKEAARYAEQKNIVLALENVWGKFLMSPMEFCAFVDSFKSEAVGAYFDVANVLAFGYPQDWIRILSHRIKSIHFKDYRIAAGGVHGFCNPFDGDVDWVAVKRALEEVNYSGYIVAETIIPKTWQNGFLSELAKKMDCFVSEM